ncbi:MAG: LexA family transcriptional regulator, partial [Aeromonas veronii]
AAQDWGIPPSTLRNWLSDRGTIPPLDTAAKVAKIEGVSLDWLAGNVTETQICAPHVAMKSHKWSDSSMPPGVIQIPMYEVDAAAGAGSLIVDESITDYWYVPQTWLRQERLEHAELCIINAVGDSMTPGINHGDRLLVKKNINRDKGLDGVFVINMDGNLRVKRLEVSMFPHGYHVKSDSELYPDEFIPANEMGERLYIVGEVVRVLGAPSSAPVNDAPAVATRQLARAANPTEKDGVAPVESPSAATKPGSQVG